MISDYNLARVMWDAYAKKAGGKSYDGKPLPAWDDLGEDRQLCWVEAARAAKLAIQNEP
jgi:hypothetical protein